MVTRPTPVSAHPPRSESFDSPPMIALLPWGDFIEDFLDGIGVSLDDFCSKMSGGWLFGYVEALRLQGVECTIFCFSRQAKRVAYSVHRPTGARIVLLPAPAAYHALRRRIKDPYGWTVDAIFGPSRGLARYGWRFMRHIAPYLATPVIALAHEVRRAGCCAILCQEYESPRFDVAVLIGRLLRIPVFATYQGGNWQRSGIEKYLRPMTLRRCAGLIIGSRVETARVHARYEMRTEKIACIFNPLDLSQWRPGSKLAARTTLGIPQSARVAIWHGRIDIQIKGLDVLLEAWKSVCSSRPETEFLLMLVGNGDDAELFDDLIKCMAVPRVRWVRDYLLDRSVMREYLTAADVYVFPSRREGFPVAALEAMACSLPVVAAAASGIVDILGDREEWGGIVVPVGDAQSVADNLGRLLDDEALAEHMGADAHARAEHAFSLENVGAQLNEFFRLRGNLHW